MSELWQPCALELAGKHRSGDTASRAVRAAHLERVEAVDTHVNAVVRRLAIAERIEVAVGVATPVDPVFD